MITTPSIQLASGGVYILPLDNPLVAAHFQAAHSHVGTLLQQINDEKLYRPLFDCGKGLVLLDLGANAGLVSAYAAQTCARVVAVEPAPDTFAVLQAVTAHFPNIEPVCAALSPMDGPCEFFLNDLNSTASSTVNTYGTKTTVPGLTLTTILRRHCLTWVDVCKVDVEGGEGDSLTLDQLKAARDIVQCYYIETHNCPKTTWEYKLSRLVEFFSRLGYYEMTISGMTLIARKTKP